MAEVYLTQRDIDYISRVVATEVPASIARTDPEEYSRMVNAVVDTMVNRVASESYPDTITGVANQSRQFSKITGPARLDPYGSVQAAPKASQAVQSAVAGRIADLAQGADSEIDGALSYANPNFSDASNLASWINPMIEAGAVKLGLGDSVHFHGLAPGQQPVDNVNVTAEGIPSGGIPVPYGPNDNPFALSAQAQAIDGFSGLANPVSTREAVAMANLPDVVPFGSLFSPQNGVVTAAQPAELAAPQDSMSNEWGVINGVAPALIPTMNSWAPVAAAEPVQAPMDSVTAQGFLGAPTSLQASATAKPMMGLTATADLGTNPGLLASSAVRGLPEVAPSFSQADIDRAFFNATGQGAFDPSFTEGLMGPNNPVVPTAVETSSFTPSTETSTDIASSRFSTPAKTSRIGVPQEFDTARMPGLLNPAASTASLVDQPAAPADINGFAEAIAAQRGAPTGLNSAEMQAMQGHVAYAAQKAREDAQLNSFPSFNVPATASIGGVPALDAQTTASIPSQTSSLASNTPAYQSFTPAPGVFGAYDTPRAMAGVQEQSANDLARAVETPMFNQTAVNSIPGLANENNPYGLDPMVALNAQPANAFDPQSLVSPTDMARSIQAGLLAQPTVSAPVNVTESQPAAIDPTQTGGIAPNFNQALNPTMPGLMTAPVGLSDYQLAEVEQAKQIPGVFAAQPAAVDDFLANPAAENIQVADQQSVVDQNAVVEGPATTPALEQQTQAAVTPTNTVPSTISKPATQNKGMLSGLLSPETALGGLLGGLALGPAGGLVGALAGQQIARNGGLSNVFSGGGFMAPTTQVAGGVSNIGGLYGGAFSPGSFAVANNGATITQQPGGWTSYTNARGTTNMISPTGQQSAYFGSNINPSSPDTEGRETGGLFGGLFG